MCLWRKSKLFKFLASLKMAVFVILALAVIAAVGTIVESRYDADAASAMVYRSFWMYLIMGTLSINLISVMVDRWPWKIRHTGFVCAHIGIITLLAGGTLTQKFGIDGNMYLPVGGKSKIVSLREREIAIYSSFNGDSFIELYRKPVDFLMEPASKKPIIFSAMEGPIEIIDSQNYVLTTEKFVASVDEKAGPAIRFQIHNERTSLTEWMFSSDKNVSSHRTLGPLQVYLNRAPPAQSIENAVYFESTQNLEEVKYTLLSKNADHKTSVGIVKESGSFVTPWMGFKIKVLRLIPRAKREWEFKPMERPTQATTSTIKVRFQGQEQWVQLGDILRFFTDKSAYIIKYGQQQVDIGKEINLKDFSVGMYQGTRRAMSYQSLVEVPDVGERLISMNEPLKYRGYTFYQASFESGEDVKPSASVVSVTYDPGRLLKYLGSLIMVFGIVHLFWWKKRQAKQLKENETI
jgi:hypothetical protein